MPPRIIWRKTRKLNRHFYFFKLFVKNLQICNPIKSVHHKVFVNLALWSSPLLVRIRANDSCSLDLFFCSNGIDSLMLFIEGILLLQCHFRFVVEVFLWLNAFVVLILNRCLLTLVDKFAKTDVFGSLRFANWDLEFVRSNLFIWNNGKTFISNTVSQFVLSSNKTWLKRGLALNVLIINYEIGLLNLWLLAWVLINKKWVIDLVVFTPILIWNHVWWFILHFHFWPERFGEISLFDYILGKLKNFWRL